MKDFIWGVISKLFLSFVIIAIVAGSIFVLTIISFAVEIDLIILLIILIIVAVAWQITQMVIEKGESADE